MADLEQNRLKPEKGARNILISTDGVFSMDGHIAQLDKIVALAKKHDAITMVDDCHSTDLWEQGQGTAEHCGVFGHWLTSLLVHLVKHF